MLQATKELCPLKALKYTSKSSISFYLKNCQEKHISTAYLAHFSASLIPGVIYLKLILVASSYFSHGRFRRKSSDTQNKNMIFFSRDKWRTTVSSTVSSGLFSLLICHLYDMPRKEMPRSAGSVLCPRRWEEDACASVFLANYQKNYERVEEMCGPVWRPWTREYSSWLHFGWGPDVRVLRQILFFNQDKICCIHSLVIKFNLKVSWS